MNFAIERAMMPTAFTSNTPKKRSEISGPTYSTEEYSVDELCERFDRDCGFANEDINGLNKSLQRNLVTDIGNSGGPKHARLRVICKSRAICGKSGTKLQRQIQNRFNRYKVWSDSRWSKFVSQAFTGTGYFKGVEYFESPSDSKTNRLLWKNHNVWLLNHESPMVSPANYFLSRKVQYAKP
jgi:hypothetical protein